MIPLRQRLARALRSVADRLEPRPGGKKETSEHRDMDMTPPVLDELPTGPKPIVKGGVRDLYL